MNATFGSRRKVRVVGQDDEATGMGDSEPTIKRPSRPKQRSRISFGTGATSMADEEDEGPIVIPKKGLARHALEKSASRHATAANVTSASHLPVPQQDEEIRPSYSRESLEELKNSQRSRPPDLNRSPAMQASEVQDLDVAAKFGKDLARYDQQRHDSFIPTDAEIQEKKARRAHLAKLAKYRIQPGASDEEDEEKVDRPDSDEDEFLTQRDKINLRQARMSDRKQEIETRLVRDDEDLMEGFEDFTGEDSRVALGNDAQREAKLRQRAEIRDMISAAQESDGSGQDESDFERREEYETIQTRKGMENLRMGSTKQSTDDSGARTPPKITPIPTLSSCLERLRGKLAEVEAAKAAKLRRMEELEMERKDMAEREIEIQRLLRETAEKYEKLGAEVGIGELPPSGLSGLLSEKGLENSLPGEIHS